MINITLSDEDEKQLKNFFKLFIKHIESDDDEDERQFYSTAIAFLLLNSLDEKQNSQARGLLGIPPLKKAED